MSLGRNIAHLSSIDSRKLRGKKALLRVDMNLPLTAEGGVDIAGDWRLRAIIPTIQRLRQQDVGIVLMGHLGRPEGRVEAALSLAPIAEHLSELMKESIEMASGVLGPEVDAVVAHASSGAVVMIENLRFEAGEEQNSRTFVERLAGLGDFYVNDAFAVSHRRHASIVGLPKLLPSAAGLLLEKEMAAFDAILQDPPRPFVLVLGGAKIATKAPVVQRFLEVADSIVLVGALANSVLAARGISVGASVVEDVPAFIIASNVLLPSDVVVAPSLDASQGTIVNVDAIPADEIVVDIGVETLASIRQVLGTAEMIVWNGPAGFIENTAFTSGTRSLAEAIRASSSKAVVGGGDTVGFLQRLGVLESFYHVSTGGGAMLEYLAQRTLPGIEALRSASL